MRKVILDNNGQVYVLPTTNIESMWAMIEAETLTVRIGVSTKDPNLKMIEYGYSFWNNVRLELFEKYGFGQLSPEQIRKFIKEILTPAIGIISDELAKWILDDIYDQIFGDKFQYDYRTKEFLEDTGMMDVNKTIDELMTMFIAIGIFIPYVIDVFDMNFMDVTVSKHGVETYLDIMEEKIKKAGAYSEKIEEEEVHTTNLENVKELIVEKAKIEPVSAQELANEYGLTVKDVERILENNGAIYDEFTHKWWIPNSELETRALEYLKEYAVSKGLNKLGFDEAKRVLVEHGIPSDEASAILIDLAQKGLIELNNGVITIPQVAETVLSKKIKTGGAEVIDKLTDEIVVDLEEGNINFDGLMDVLSELAQEVNKSTFERICRSIMQKLEGIDTDKHAELKAWLKENYGTVSCRKLYDVLKTGSAE